MKHRKLIQVIRAIVLLSSLTMLGGELPEPAEKKPVAPIKPAVSTQSGLLLEPPLDLSKFTTEDFTAISATVGPEKIRKKWESPVTTLPPHPRTQVHGLSETEISGYMIQVKKLFDQGASIPVSDVGLISTQEDVVRRPMLNHVAVFSNEVAHVYLLVQKTPRNKNWGYFAIVQDRTTTPPQDYFGEIQGEKIKFEGKNCYRCHSSGPLAIHPARADLVSDAPLAAAISKHIADLPLSIFHFPAGDNPPDYGRPLTLKACTKCHDAEGDRQPLYRVHSHPIRVLVDFGYMPPKHGLTPEEIAELKAWLEEKK